MTLEQWISIEFFFFLLFHKKKVRIKLPLYRVFYPSNDFFDVDFWFKVKTLIYTHLYNFMLSYKFTYYNILLILIYCYLILFYFIAIRAHTIFYYYYYFYLTHMWYSRTMNFSWILLFSICFIKKMRIQIQWLSNHEFQLNTFFFLLFHKK